jgi:MYXO-CTERM domain-containing protein
MIRTRLFWAGSAVATIVSASTLASAADYYFDSVGGDDSKDGATEATAKKTFKMPTGSGHTVHLKRGSTFSGNLSANNVTVVAYGCGIRPTFNGSISVSKATVEGIRALAVSSSGINVQSDSVVRDCESEGTNFDPTKGNAAGAMGITVMGTNNQIIGNYVHDWGASQSGVSMNNSGGAEGIMVMASNNEIAFNRVVNCISPNQQLGGVEGGCMEIVNGKADTVISNVSFHHNYCERSVGMWEGCSGNFSSDGAKIQEHHGIIENVTVSYNISVDAMWMYLLQPVNTDFKNVVFANNTIIHTPKTKEYFTFPVSTDFPKGLAYTDGGHAMMGIGVDKDTVVDTATGQSVSYTTENAYYKMATGFEPGTIIVKNNIFADTVESGVNNSMFILKVADHSNNIFIPASASLGVFTLGSTEKKVNLADMGFNSDYQLTENSTPAIDQGVTIDMNTNAGLASTQVSTAIFGSTFTQDVARHAVPCGAAPDIGASEYCVGPEALTWPSTGDSCGAGGTPSMGGAAGTGGAPAAGGTRNAGGAAATGGIANVTTGGANANTGGRISSSGGAAMSTGGKATAGGAPLGIGGAISSTGGRIQGNSSAVQSTGGMFAATTGGASVVPNAGGGQADVGGQANQDVGGSASLGVGGSNVGAPATSGTVQNGASVDEGGCSCRVAGTNRSSWGAALTWLGLAFIALGRRRLTPSLAQAARPSTRAPR